MKCKFKMIRGENSSQVCTFVGSLVRSFRRFVRSLLRAFILLVLCSYVPTFVCSFVVEFIYFAFNCAKPRDGLKYRSLVRLFFL